MMSGEFHQHRMNYGTVLLKQHCIIYDTFLVMTLTKLLTLLTEATNKLVEIIPLHNETRQNTSLDTGLNTTSTTYVLFLWSDCNGSP